jgi:poly(3-hydroxybutyrate) depolymerase
MGAAGMRRYRLYRPPGIQFGEKLPLMVMLHGCSQDAKSFARSTRMNIIAARERFMVLYPE